MEYASNISGASNITITRKMIKQKQNRYTIKTKVYIISWIDKREKRRKKNPKIKINKLYSCMCNPPQVFNSPFTNKHINIKYYRRGEFINIKNYSFKNPSDNYKQT